MPGKCKRCGSYAFKTVSQGCKIIEARCITCGDMPNTMGIKVEAIMGPLHCALCDVARLRNVKDLSDEDKEALLTNIESTLYLIQSEVHNNA